MSLKIDRFIATFNLLYIVLFMNTIYDILPLKLLTDINAFLKFPLTFTLTKHFAKTCKSTHEIKNSLDDERKLT